MNSDQIFILVNNRRTSLAAFAKMAQAEIKTVDASGCTALTELKADAAEYVYASGCTALTELPFVDGGTNERGYEMFAVMLRGEWRVCAGCRNFTLDEARAHWGAGSRAHSAILERLEKMAADMAAKDSARVAA